MQFMSVLMVDLSGVHKPLGYTRVKGGCGTPPLGLQSGAESLGTEGHSLESWF